MTREIAPPELVRTAILEQALYDHVDNYAVPEDMNYKDVIDVKKLASYRDKNLDTLDHPLQIVYRKRYNQKRGGSKNVMTIGYVNGIKTASIENPTGLNSKKLLIHDCDSLDNNGIWNYGGNIDNLIIDNLNHIQGKGSLKFNLNNTTNTGYIENSTLEPVDLYDFLQRGAIFSSLSVPVMNKIISIRFRLYSSTTDYYDYTVNRPHNANSFQIGWNVLKFVFSNQFIVGNPNPRELTKIRFDFITNGEQVNDVRLDGIFARTGETYEVTYQSSFCIIDPETGEWKLRVDSGNDILPFEDDSYNIFMLEVLMELKKELQGKNNASNADMQSTQLELSKAYDYYKMDHPSEVIEDSIYTYTFGDSLNGYQDDILGAGYNETNL